MNPRWVHSLLADAVITEAQMHRALLRNLLLAMIRLQSTWS